MTIRLHPVVGVVGGGGDRLHLGRPVGRAVVLHARRSRSGSGSKSGEVFYGFGFGLFRLDQVAVMRRQRGRGRRRSVRVWICLDRAAGGRSVQRVDRHGRVCGRCGQCSRGPYGAGVKRTRPSQRGGVGALGVSAQSPDTHGVGSVIRVRSSALLEATAQGAQELRASVVETEIGWDPVSLVSRRATHLRGFRAAVQLQ